MAGIMMLSREVRRVPLDFDFPLHKTWEGYLMPEEFRLPDCHDCDGTGFSVWARQMNDTWYALAVPDDRAREEYRWDTKLTQFDVDALIRSRRLNPVIDCPEGCKRPRERGVKKGEAWKTDCPRCEGRGWTREQLELGAIKAEDFNRHNREKRPLDFGSMERHVIVKARCELLGVSDTCEWCEGDGKGGHDLQKLRAETWVPTDPPTGEAYQLWQTVTEGGPCSPPFLKLDELADWLSENDDSILRGKSPAEWMKILEGEVIGTEISTGALV